MRKILYILSLTTLFFGCNDGDIIEYEVDFDDIETIEYCGDLVLYKIKEEPFESLSIQIDKNFEDFINDYENADGIVTADLSLAANSFHYRKYSGSYNEDLFCNDIPTNVNITSDDVSDGGFVVITTELVEDDGDGIPAELEDINENGDLEDDDTDNDGIPNYLDEDDDGDNVPTIYEVHNYTTADGLTNAQNTDGQGDPDYLDPDDDGDGVLTRDEENESADQNPRNDMTGENNIADYLDPEIAETVTATAYREHTILQEYTITIQVENLTLPEFNQELYEFGSMVINSDPCPCSRTETPDFN